MALSTEPKDPINKINATNIEKEVSQYFNIQDLGLFISKAIDAAIVLTAVLCLFFLLYGGITWMISQGDKNKYEEARNRIMASVIGLALVVLTWLIWKLILYFLGVGQESDSGIIFKFF